MLKQIFAYQELGDRKLFRIEVITVIQSMAKLYMRHLLRLFFHEGSSNEAYLELLSPFKL